MRSTSRVAQASATGGEETAVGSRYLAAIRPWSSPVSGRIFSVSFAAAALSGRKIAARARLKAVWKLAIWRAGSASIAASSGAKAPIKGKSAIAPARRISRLPSGMRRAVRLSEKVSATRMMPEPILAPSTSAKPSVVGTTPTRVRDMISSTRATLEWASQARTAASSSARIGSLDRGTTTLRSA